MDIIYHKSLFVLTFIRFIKSVFQLLVCVFIVSTHSFAQPPSLHDTLIIYFDHDKTLIKPKYTEPLKALKDKLFNTPNKILLVHGYADHTGSDPYNQDLSARRAAAVVSFLQNMDIPVSLIESIRGKGSIQRSLPPNQRVPEDRKVMVVLANRTEPLIFSEFNLNELNRGDKLVIDRLYFRPGRHILLTESIPRLKKLLHILEKHPSLQIELQGHVCCAPAGRDGIDKDTQEERLSINRAHNIYKYLVRNGIDSNRLSYQGFARTQPLYPLERNDHERKMNRRVEIEIIDF